MRDAHRSFVVLAVVTLGFAALAFSACSEGGTAAAVTTLTCQQIRLCVAQTPCATDACVQACAAKGTPAAQAAYETLRACTAGVCAVDDVNCACNEQCNADGACLAEVDGCLAG